jgi:hypothetical protein
VQVLAGRTTAVQVILQTPPEETILVTAAPFDSSSQVWNPTLVLNRREIEALPLRPDQVLSLAERAPAILRFPGGSSALGPGFVTGGSGPQDTRVLLDGLEVDPQVAAGNGLEIVPIAHLSVTSAAIDPSLPGAGAVVQITTEPPKTGGTGSIRLGVARSTQAGSLGRQFDASAEQSGLVRRAPAPLFVWARLGFSRDDPSRASWTQASGALRAGLDSSRVSGRLYVQAMEDADRGSHGQPAALSGPTPDPEKMFSAQASLIRSASSWSVFEGRAGWATLINNQSPREIPGYSLSAIGRRRSVTSWQLSSEYSFQPRVSPFLDETRFGSSFRERNASFPLSWQPIEGIFTASAARPEELAATWAAAHRQVDSFIAAWSSQSVRWGPTHGILALRADRQHGDSRSTEDSPQPHPADLWRLDRDDVGASRDFELAWQGLSPRLALAVAAGERLVLRATVGSYPSVFDNDAPWRDPAWNRLALLAGPRSDDPAQIQAQPRFLQYLSSVGDERFWLRQRLRPARSDVATLSAERRRGDGTWSLTAGWRRTRHPLTAQPWVADLGSAAGPRAAPLRPAVATDYVWRARQGDYSLRQGLVAAGILIGNAERSENYTHVTVGHRRTTARGGFLSAEGTWSNWRSLGRSSRPGEPPGLDAWGLKRVGESGAGFLATPLGSIRSPAWSYIVQASRSLAGKARFDIDLGLVASGHSATDIALAAAPDDRPRASSSRWQPLASQNLLDARLGLRTTLGRWPVRAAIDSFGLLRNSAPPVATPARGVRFNLTVSWP